MEEWKDIPGYEGLYAVSNTGKVKAFQKVIVKERILKPCLAGIGYEAVNLYNENGIQREYVHRLVASAFVENPNKLPYVNHKDEVKTNNHADNLEWCTPAYNVNYGTCIEKRTKHTDYKKVNMERSKKVYQYTLDKRLVRVYESLSECCRVNGYNASNISKCCRSNHRIAYGYFFRYEETD